MKRQLIQRWNDVLDASIEELHTSASPIHSTALQQHYDSLSSMHLDLARVDKQLSARIRSYVSMLEDALCHMLFDDRVRSLAMLRFARADWLPAFSMELDTA